MNENTICIFINKEEKKKKRKNKILKKYQKVYLLLGDMINLKHLNNYSLKKTIFILLLISNTNKRINYDLTKNICYRTTQIFFNLNSVIEIYSTSLKYLGNTPFYIINEFFHPLYMSGKVLSLEHFDKLLPKLYLNEKKQKVG